MWNCALARTELKSVFDQRELGEDGRTSSLDYSSSSSSTKFQLLAQSFSLLINQKEDNNLSIQGNLCIREKFHSATDVCND